MIYIYIYIHIVVQRALAEGAPIGPKNPCANCTMVSHRPTEGVRTLKGVPSKYYFLSDLRVMLK